MLPRPQGARNCTTRYLHTQDCWNFCHGAMFNADGAHKVIPDHGSTARRSSRRCRDVQGLAGCSRSGHDQDHRADPYGREHSFLRDGGRKRGRCPQAAGWATRRSRCPAESRRARSNPGPAGLPSSAPPTERSPMVDQVGPEDPVVGSGQGCCTAALRHVWPHVPGLRMARLLAVLSGVRQAAVHRGPGIRDAMTGWTRRWSCPVGPHGRLAQRWSRR